MTTREELFERGEAVRAKLGTVVSDDDTAPGYQRMISEAIYGGIWGRPGLALADRDICVLAALALKQCLPQVRRHTKGALKIGLTPRTILEVFVHCGLYGGFPTIENSIAAAREVFREEGLEVEAEPDTDESLDELEARGQALLTELHGERGTQGYASPDNPVTGGLYGMAIQYGYGWLWHRAGLDRRQRMLIALAAFTVLGLESQLRKFSRSALNVGLSREEIIEAVMQTAPYGGFPGTLNALAAIEEVLA